jgi:hypothetical protein
MYEFQGLFFKIFFRGGMSLPPQIISAAPAADSRPKKKTFLLSDDV